jgi:replicative DNA helicase
MTQKEPGLPQSPNSERSLIGALLMDPSMLASVQQFISADDFALDSNRQIFSTMLEMDQAGTPIDLVTLTYELERRGKLETFGGAAYVGSLIDGVPDWPGNAEHYAKMIGSDARARRLYHAASATMSAILGKEPVDDVISRLEEKILALLHRGQGGPRPMGEIVRGYLSNFAEVCNRQGKCIGLRTSLADLDAMTTGLRRGEYWVAAGRTGDGKSALLQQIGLANARDGRHVYLQSLEMNAETFIERAAAALTGIPYDDVRDPRYLEKARREEIKEAARKLADLPWVIDDAGGLDIQQLVARARAQINRGAELVLVDYLQMVHCSEHSSTYDRVSAVSAGLRDLARTAQVPVVAACQLRRPQPGYENTVPSLYDLKESGSIENDASTVLLIYRPIDKETGLYTGNDQIRIAKQRHGPRGTVDVTFIGEKTKFELRCAAQIAEHAEVSIGGYQ